MCTSAASVEYNVSVYKILYTNQKLKKCKSWQDGTLLLTKHQNRAMLYDDEKKRIDVIVIASEKVCVGEVIESERYLVQIDEELIPDKNSKQIWKRIDENADIDFNGVRRKNKCGHVREMDAMVDSYCDVKYQLAEDSPVALPVMAPISNRLKRLHKVPFIPPRPLRHTPLEKDHSAAQFPSGCQRVVEHGDSCLLKTFTASSFSHLSDTSDPRISTFNYGSVSAISSHCEPTTGLDLFQKQKRYGMERIKKTVKTEKAAIANQRHDDHDNDFYAKNLSNRSMGTSATTFTTTGQEKELSVISREKTKKPTEIPTTSKHSVTDIIRLIRQSADHHVSNITNCFQAVQSPVLNQYSVHYLNRLEIDDVGISTAGNSFTERFRCGSMHNNDAKNSLYLSEKTAVADLENKVQANVVKSVRCIDNKSVFYDGSCTLLNVNNGVSLNDDCKSLLDTKYGSSLLRNNQMTVALTCSDAEDQLFDSEQANEFENITIENDKLVQLVPEENRPWDEDRVGDKYDEQCLSDQQIRMNINCNAVICKLDNEIVQRSKETVLYNGKDILCEEHRNGVENIKLCNEQIPKQMKEEDISALTTRCGNEHLYKVMEEFADVYDLVWDSPEWESQIDSWDTVGVVDSVNEALERLKSRTDYGQEDILVPDELGSDEKFSRNDNTLDPGHANLMNAAYLPVASNTTQPQCSNLSSDDSRNSNISGNVDIPLTLTQLEECRAVVSSACVSNSSVNTAIYSKDVACLNLNFSPLSTFSDFSDEQSMFDCHLKEGCIENSLNDGCNVNSLLKVLPDRKKNCFQVDICLMSNDVVTDKEDVESKREEYKCTMEASVRLSQLAEEHSVDVQSCTAESQTEWFTLTGDKVASVPDAKGVKKCISQKDECSGKFPLEHQQQIKAQMGKANIEDKYITKFKEYTDDNVRHLDNSVTNQNGLFERKLPVNILKRDCASYDTNFKYVIERPNDTCCSLSTFLQTTPYLTQQGSILEYGKAAGDQSDDNYQDVLNLDVEYGNSDTYENLQNFDNLYNANEKREHLVPDVPEQMELLMLNISQRNIGRHQAKKLQQTQQLEENQYFADDCVISSNKSLNETKPLEKNIWYNQNVVFGQSKPLYNFSDGCKDLGDSVSSPSTKQAARIHAAKIAKDKFQAFLDDIAGGVIQVEVQDDLVPFCWSPEMSPCSRSAALGQAFISCSPVLDVVEENAPTAVAKVSPTIITLPSSSPYLSAHSSAIITCEDKMPQFLSAAQKPCDMSMDIYDDILFPSCSEVENCDKSSAPARKVFIPVEFKNVYEYKRVFSAALVEHLNIQLFELAKNYFSHLAAVDLSHYTSANEAADNQKKNMISNPLCEHRVASKLCFVKKEGRNHGRCFYTCTNQLGQQCHFFKWADTGSSCAGVNTNKTRLQLNNPESISTYFKKYGVALYCDCYFVRKVVKPIQKSFFRRYSEKREESCCERKILLLQLSQKISGTDYSKDNLWIISATLDFERGNTFLAKSVSYGHSAKLEVEIELIGKVSESVWNNRTPCHAIHFENSTTEISCLLNIDNHVSVTSLPLLTRLINRSEDVIVGQKNEDVKLGRFGFSTPKFTPKSNTFSLSSNVKTKEIATEFIRRFNLNVDQSEALMNVALMIDSQTTSPITLVHGVFGSGKSYLLAVVVLFLVDVLNQNDAQSSASVSPLQHKRILVSSTTNVAVDRVLTSLLEIGFTQFIRVGNSKKISRAIMPYSYASQKLKEKQPAEDKLQLSGVRVVGATCAACTLNCMQGLQFPIVLLDECSQMTEPASLLAIARFSCHRLVLVGDPNQLGPTLQGSEAGPEGNGLELTLFSRLLMMGHSRTMLRVQYRCHPCISRLASILFYEDQLMDGVTEDERQPLIPDWPTLCFINVCAGSEMREDGEASSLYNMAEVKVIISLIRSLLAGGILAQNIGIITLYRSQQTKIYHALNELGDSAVLKSLAVSTVDAFQGAERDVIILSCVRTQNVRFIDCDKYGKMSLFIDLLSRINVALTRARHHLLIVGHKMNVSRSSLWNKIVNYCQSQENGVCDSVVFLETFGKITYAVEDERKVEKQRTGKRVDDDCKRPSVSVPPDNDSSLMLCGKKRKAKKDSCFSRKKLFRGKSKHFLDTSDAQTTLTQLW